MKRLSFILTISLLSACVKTKLEGNYEVLQGKWQWGSAVETKEDLSTGYTTYTDLSAENYSALYFFEFSRTGHVYFLKDEACIEKYRTRVKVFSDNCNFFPDCLMFIIRLDNKEDQAMMVNANSDSLHCISTHTHLPLQNYSDNTDRYSYSYKFVKVN